MKKYLQNLMATVVIPTIFITGFNNAASAININPEIANINYWYGDEDIRGVITNRLGNAVYVAPAVLNSPSLINDVASAALNEARAGLPALIPVNLNGNHWTALAIRTKVNGDVVVFYNDSFGSSLGGATTESGMYIEAIKKLVPNAEIIDLQVHQQNDSSSCGAFTAENLIALSMLDQNALTYEAAREVLKDITDAKAIRIMQLNALSSLYQKIVTSQELAQANLTKNNIETTTELAYQETGNLSSLLINRLSHLHLADNGDTGISAGDEQLNYGAWVSGIVGKGLFKAKYSSKIKHNIGGATIGFDGKIDDDTILGVALSYNINSLKPKVASSNNDKKSHTDFSTNTRSIIGSVYGSMQADEQLVIHGNITLGKLYGKTKYQSFLSEDNSFKLKGELFGANIGANYYIPLASLVLVPSLTGSYEGVKFAAVKQGNFNTDKTYVQKFSITPSLSLATTFEYENFQLIPEVTASYTNSPFIKSKKLKVRNASGRILSCNKISVTKDSYNLGASLTLASERIETSIGYERTAQPKYLGHIGYLKLRINI
ncbi:Autotransporter outer membrane beta-barrel domain-containing protein [Candidatus Megaera venefica]|uniref:Autotransporter outer membrane beta-barrel domain-containing protein n=1 Tax=Candidatus Megaera venefica TaxID=2055910 RepID=A0ABU5NC04_9RICK|nr:autotransporter domain-containing protein [Candidatus Megaera venefica]MEA0970703.1 Autotransporter outer membrane beta-barrel domain-containing protein [Candidatus Megaera venefica]